MKKVPETATQLDISEVWAAQYDMLRDLPKIKLNNISMDKNKDNNIFKSKGKKPDCQTLNIINDFNNQHFALNSI